MAGFRAAGWTCAGTLVLAVLIALAGLRGIGLVGQQRVAQAEKPMLGDVEMVPRRRDSVTREGPVPATRAPASSSAATLAVEEVEVDVAVKQSFVV